MDLKQPVSFQLLAQERRVTRAARPGRVRLGYASSLKNLKEVLSRTGALVGAPA